MQALVTVSRLAADNGPARLRCFAKLGPNGGTLSPIGNFAYQLFPEWPAGGTPVPSTTYSQVVVTAADSVGAAGVYDVAIDCAQGNGDVQVFVNDATLNVIAAAPIAP